jgi:hypothetical protein
MKDLGYDNGWHDGGIEIQLVRKAREAGYKFTEVSHNERGTDTVYECQEAGLRYHVDSSD